MTEKVISLLIELVFAVIGLLVTGYLIPFLKEKQLYKTVKSCVEAAEKLSENKKIDKKEYVIDLLESKGITVDSTVEAIIEAAVLELDLLISGIKSTEGSYGGI